jgi:glycosyltransferase involved in cell wall biosynthesis
MDTKEVEELKREYPALIWVYFGSLTGSLDRATWVETSAVLCDLGWHVTLIAVDFPQDEVDKRIRVIRLPRPKLYLVGYLIFHLFLLFHIIFNYQRADIILFHQPSALFLLPLVLLRNLLRMDRPYFVMDSRTENMVTTTRRGKLWGLVFNVADDLADHLADGRTVNTARMAQAQGIPDQKLLGTWSSGVVLERFKPASLMHCWPVDDEPLRLIYIGALFQERNLLALIEAVQAVRNEGYNITLDLFGEGPQKKELQVIAHQMDDGGIRVCSAVPPSDVPRILANAHIGVLPFPDMPIFQVSSPIKLFEYMAAGMPILATKIVCHTDVLGESDFVFWAADGNPTALAGAIREAFANKTKLSLMGSRAAVAARVWSWENSAKKLDVALRRLGSW